MKILLQPHMTLQCKYFPPLFPERMPSGLIYSTSNRRSDSDFPFGPSPKRNVLQYRHQPCAPFYQRFISAEIPHVVGPEELGGQALPNIYVEQGISKLPADFLAHLCLQDKTGKLMEIGMTYIQLFAGLTRLILNESYNQFQNWIDPGWLTFKWEFSNSSHLPTSYPNIGHQN